jgi:hypothetical protein
VFEYYPITRATLPFERTLRDATSFWTAQRFHMDHPGLSSSALTVEHRFPARHNSFAIDLVPLRL